MSKNLIYANADEFHVKSTLVYESGKTLYWDSECTKPIYSDELERLFLAGGMKIMSYSDGKLTGIYSADAYLPGSDKTPSSVNAGMLQFRSTFRPTEDSNEDSENPVIDHQY